MSVAARSPSARCWQPLHDGMETRRIPPLRPICRAYSSGTDAQKNAHFLKARLEFLEKKRHEVGVTKNKGQYQVVAAELGVKIQRGTPMTTEKVQQQLVETIEHEMQEIRLQLASVGQEASSSVVENGPNKSLMFGGLAACAVAVGGIAVYLQGGTPIATINEDVSAESSVAAPGKSAGSLVDAKGSAVKTAGGTPDTADHVVQMPAVDKEVSQSPSSPSPGAVSTKATKQEPPALSGEGEASRGGGVALAQLDEWGQTRLGLQPGELQQGLIIAAVVLGVGFVSILTYRCLNSGSGGGSGSAATLGDRGGSSELGGASNSPADTGSAPPQADAAAAADAASGSAAAAITGQTIPGRSPTTSSQGATSGSFPVQGKVAEGIATRRAGEEIFENQPDPNQAWDMSASIHGISGGVKQAAAKFDKK